MFPIAHAQAQTSIAKYQFVSLLGSLCLLVWLSPWAIGKHEFRLNKGYIEAVSCPFWLFLPYISCSIAWKNALFWLRSRSAEMRGQRRHPPYTPYSIGYLSRAILKTHSSHGGLDNSQSHSANVFRADDPRSEPRVLHELTQKKMAEDSESDIAIRFVDEND